MKRKGLFLFSSVIALSLTACATNVKHDISEYILELNYSDNYRILQLSDTHFGDKDDLDTQFKFLDLTIKDANPNLIVITGDVFTFASRTTAKRLFEFLDSYGISWTLTFGNHDEQCFFSVDWLTSLLNNYGSNCVFKDIQDDNVQGNANFAINLMQGTNIFEQLIIMDSNRYYFGSYFGYDYFKQNQIDWYSDLIDYTTAQNGGTVVQSLMFYHIPLPEINSAFADGDKDRGEMQEPTCPPDYNSGFFDVIKAKGSTKAMFFGHDHVNDFISKYEGIDFAYGIKATDRVYYDEEKLGGRLIIIKPDHSLEYQDIFHKYGEIE